MLEEEKEDIPVLSLVDVTRWRKKLRPLFTPRLIGETIDKGIFMDLVDTISDMIKKSVKVPSTDDIHPDHVDIIRPVVSETLTNMLAGRVMDMDLAEHAIGRIAGGMRILKAGKPLLPWNGQPHEEWVLAMVRSTTFHKTPKKKIPGANLEFYIVAGSAADMTFTQFFPDFVIYKMAVMMKMLGRKDNRYYHHRELVKSYMLLKLDIGTELRATKYQERDALNKRNKLRAERRADYRKRCPIKSQWPCHFCPVGYRTCELGTHRDDYIKLPCPGHHEGWYSKDRRGGYCLYCQAKTWQRNRR